MQQASLQQMANLREFAPGASDSWPGVHPITYEGETWSAATNGRVLVMSRDVAPTHEKAMGERMVPGILGPRAVWHSVSLSMLSTWTANVAACPVCSGSNRAPCSCKVRDGKRWCRCPECHGSGQVLCSLDHWHECESCDSLGEVACDGCVNGIRACDECKYAPIENFGGTLFGRAIDRRLLLPALRLFDTETVEISVGTALDAIAFRAPGRLAIVMPVRMDPLPAGNGRVFP